MRTKKLYLLNGGLLELDKSIITYRTDMGKKIKIPVVMSLIETSEGYVLFDTGLNPEGINNPQKAWGEKASLIVKFEKENDIRNRLKELGLKINDIKYVVNSHLHYDHTGGNKFFKKAKFVVQKAEYRFAHFPDEFASHAYIKNHFDLPFNYFLIEGDYELLPGLYIIFTPGHTPGSQSLLVELPKTGKVLLTGDAIYCHENIDKNIPAGNCWDTKQAMISMNRISQICKREKAKIFITHQPNIEKELLFSPLFYN
jgi:N-acyl homoserine lactone hydrolase